jgi:hypothetical protein
MYGILLFVSSHRIQQLREVPGVLKKLPETAQGHSFSIVQGGLPHSGLVEIAGPLGSGKTQVLLKFLAENPKLRVAWVENRFSIYPPSFIQNRVELERVLFVDSPSEKLFWSAQQILRSQVFEVLVIRGEAARDEIELRRLQIIAEKSEALVFLLREETTQEGSWPIGVQIQVRRLSFQKSPLVKIHKYRGRS